MASLYKEKVGAAIKARREALHLTQRQLGDRIGVEAQTISRWERGANLGKESNLEAVAVGLELTVEELMSGIERPTKAPDLNAALGGQPEWAIRMEAQIAEIRAMLLPEATPTAAELEILDAAGELLDRQHNAPETPIQNQKAAGRRRRTA